MNEYGRDILEIRAIFLFGDNDQGRRVIQKVYWVIARNSHVFTKNKTWVFEIRSKTDKFRDKTAFDSIQEAITFTEKHWNKIKI